MTEAADAKRDGDDSRYDIAQQRVECFTNQLNDSNPILTEISDAMTAEGEYSLKLEAAKSAGHEDLAMKWQEKMNSASERKKLANERLMQCSALYEATMKAIREASG